MQVFCQILLTFLIGLSFIRDVLKSLDENDCCHLLAVMIINGAFTALLYGAGLFSTFSK